MPVANKHSEHILADDVFDALQRQDENAFKICFDFFFPRICAFLCTLVSAKDAEELAHDTFLKLWEHVTHFKTPQHLNNWLYFIARNSAINLLNAQKVYNKHLNNFSQAADDTEEDATRSEWLSQLHESIALLPEMQRNVIKLMLDRQNDEVISKTLGIQKTTVRTHKAKAILNLRAILEKVKKLLPLLFLLLTVNQLVLCQIAEPPKNFQK